MTCPSTSLPLALREWAGVFFSLARSAARRSSMLQTRRPQQFDRRLVGGEVAAVLGDLAQLVVQRLDRVGGAEVTRRRAGGKARKAVFLSQALSHARRRLGVLAARVGLAEGAWGPSGGLLVGGGAGSGAGRRRPPCGPLWATNRTGGADQVDHAGGDHGVGPGPPRAASGRPVSPSQHTISTPLARPCWPDRRTRGALQGGPLPVLDPDP